MKSDSSNLDSSFSSIHSPNKNSNSCSNVDSSSSSVVKKLKKKDKKKLKKKYRNKLYYNRKKQQLENKLLQTNNSSNAQTTSSNNNFSQTNASSPTFFNHDLNIFSENENGMFYMVFMKLWDNKFTLNLAVAFGSRPFVWPAKQTIVS